MIHFRPLSERLDWARWLGFAIGHNLQCHMDKNFVYIDMESSSYQCRSIRDHVGSVKDIVLAQATSGFNLNRMAVC